MFLSWFTLTAKRSLALSFLSNLFLVDEDVYSFHHASFLLFVSVVCYGTCNVCNGPSCNQIDDDIRDWPDQNDQKDTVAVQLWRSVPQPSNLSDPLRGPVPKSQTAPTDRQRRFPTLPTIICHAVHFELASCRM